LPLLYIFARLKRPGQEKNFKKKLIMKKHIYCAVLFVFAGSLTLSAQEAETLNPALRPPGQQVFKYRNTITQDKTEQFEIQGLGGTNFTSSNTVDGTAGSYKHSLQISVALVPVNKAGNSNYQLIFYSPNDNMPEAVTSKDGSVSIYYPLSVYDDIRSKLEQAFTARKKVTVKVTQKTNGYREGTLVL
jgi:hypothetical protein